MRSSATGQSNESYGERFGCWTPPGVKTDFTHALAQCRAKTAFGAGSACSCQPPAKPPRPRRRRAAERLPPLGPRHHDDGVAPVAPARSGPFQPHPAELQVAGFNAPVLIHEGAGWLTRVVSTRLGESAAWLFTLCTALLLGLAAGVSLAAVHARNNNAPAEVRSTTSVADPSVVVPLAVLSWALGFGRAGAASRFSAAPADGLDGLGCVLTPGRNTLTLQLYGLT